MLIQLGGGENLKVIKRMGWINLDEKELKLERNLEWREFLWR
jgi:hypothetical protein